MGDHLEVDPVVLTQTMVRSAFSNADLTSVRTVAPAPANRTARSGLRFQIVTEYCFSSATRAIADPMFPHPITATSN